LVELAAKLTAASRHRRAGRSHMWPSPVVANAAGSCFFLGLCDSRGRLSDGII